MTPNQKRWLGRYWECQGSEGHRYSLSEVKSGIRQWLKWDTHGAYPENPNRVFAEIKSGKASQNWMENDLKALYGTEDWPGFLQLSLDYPRWLFARMFRWYKGIDELANSLYPKGEK